MTWLATWKGRAFNLVEPRSSDVDFEEIAHCLAHLRRFNGHTLLAYSVAEHSCRVADLLPEPMKIYGLLHDAAEAYIGDLSRPFKEALPQMVPASAGSIVFALNDLDRRVSEAIHIAANLAWPLPADVAAAVAAADNRLLATEKRDLMAPCERPWQTGIVPLDDKIRPWQSAKAESEFLRRLGKWLRLSRKAAA